MSTHIIAAWKVTALGVVIILTTTACCVTSQYSESNEAHRSPEMERKTEMTKKYYDEVRLSLYFKDEGAFRSWKIRHSEKIDALLLWVENNCRPEAKYAFRSIESNVEIALMKNGKRERSITVHIDYSQSQHKQQEKLLEKQLVPFMIEESDRYIPDDYSKVIQSEPYEYSGASSSAP